MSCHGPVHQIQLFERCGVTGGQEKFAGHLRLLSQQPAISFAAQDSIRASRGTLSAKRAWTSGCGWRWSGRDLLGLSRKPWHLPPKDARSKVNHWNIPATCGQCHMDIAKTYLESVHGQAMKDGVAAAPGVQDCHGEHMILAPKESGIAGERIPRFDGNLRTMPQR